MHKPRTRSSWSRSAEHLTVSLKTLAKKLDADRTSVRRWLANAGVRAVVVGRGRNAAIRYRWRDIEQWLETREEID